MDHDDYAVLLVVGTEDVPQAVKDAMNEHVEKCPICGKKGYGESMIGVQITSELEQAANEIIAGLCE